MEKISINYANLMEENQYNYVKDNCNNQNKSIKITHQIYCNNIILFSFWIKLHLYSIYMIQKKVENEK